MGRTRPLGTSLRTSLDQIILFGIKQYLQWPDLYPSHLPAMGPSHVRASWGLRGQIPRVQASYAGSKELEGQERENS